MSRASESTELAHYIDHTVLRPDASEVEIRQACTEAKRFGFKTVCTDAKWLPVTSVELAGSAVLPIVVVAFPHGKGTPEEKAKEAASAVAGGAKEIDMVLNREPLYRRDHAAVYRDVRAVVEAVSGVPVKVILETSELSDSEKIAASAICRAAGARFVKTSTGFSKSGATEHDVALMRQIVGPECGVKASGGVRSRTDALKMIAAGADRIGTSAGVTIVGDGGSKASGGSY